MGLSLRISLLAGMAAALALPAAAQEQTPPAQETGRILTLPPAPNYAAVMRWPVVPARALLAVVEGIGTEGLDPKDYRIADLRAAIEAGPGERLDEVASQVFTW